MNVVNSAEEPRFAAFVAIDWVTANMSGRCSQLMRIDASAARSNIIPKRWEPGSQC